MSLLFGSREGLRDQSLLIPPKGNRTWRGFCTQEGLQGPDQFHFLIKSLTMNWVNKFTRFTIIWFMPNILVNWNYVLLFLCLIRHKAYLSLKVSLVQSHSGCKEKVSILCLFVLHVLRDTAKKRLTSNLYSLKLSLDNL